MKAVSASYFLPKHPLAVIMSVLLLVSGCVNTPPASGLPKAPRDTAPPLTLAPQLEPYRLQVGDVMDVKVALNPELNDQVTVRPDGLISTSLASDVPAYGRTPDELRADLQERYKSQLRDPHIAVMIRSFAPNRVYVLGEVVSPGEFISVGPNLTMLQAIARAGGLKNSADPHYIVIVRRGAGEKPQAFAANYRDAASGKDPASDVRLAPYDVVFVPRSDIGDVYLHFQQYLQEFLPIGFGMSYQLNPQKVQ
jgi:polysaccharide export outer membrane protein